MCIILGLSNAEHPKDTKIYSMNVSANNDENYKLMIYKNNLNFHNRQMSSIDDNNEIMIVVVPSDPDADIGLVDIQTQNIKQLCEHLETSSKKITKYDNYNRSMRSNSVTLSSTNFMYDDMIKAKIHNIGNYEISVVNSVDEIKTKIDWTHFTMPDNLDHRINTINNKNLFPFVGTVEGNYRVIICKATENNEDDGFGIVYKAYFLTKYFPVCHESQPNSERNRRFDFKLFELLSDITNVPTQTMFKSDSQTQYHDLVGSIAMRSNNTSKSMVGRFNSKDVTNLMRIMTNHQMTMATSGDVSCFDLLPFEYLQYTPVKTTGPNQNIIE